MDLQYRLNFARGLVVSYLLLAAVNLALALDPTKDLILTFLAAYINLCLAYFQWRQTFPLYRLLMFFIGDIEEQVPIDAEYTNAVLDRLRDARAKEREQIRRDAPASGFPPGT